MAETRRWSPIQKKRKKKKALHKEKRDARVLSLTAARPSAFTLPSASGVSMPVPESSAPPFVLSVSDVSLPVLGLSAPPSESGVPVPVPRSSPSPFST